MTGKAIVMLLLIAVITVPTAACGDAGSSAPPTATVPVTPTVTPSPTPEPACSTKDGKKVYDLLQAEAQEWDDAVTLANSTPRMQLAAQIQHLQSVRRDTQAQDWPECAAPAKDALIAAMNDAIDAFIAFLGQKPDADVTALFDKYRIALGTFETELYKLQ